MTINQQRPRLDALIEAIAAPLRKVRLPLVGAADSALEIAAGLEALAADIAPAPAIGASLLQGRMARQRAASVVAPAERVGPMEAFAKQLAAIPGVTLLSVSPSQQAISIRFTAPPGSSNSDERATAPTVICTVCHTVLTPGDERISHGLCESCFAGFVRAE